MIHSLTFIEIDQWYYHVIRSEWYAVHIKYLFLIISTFFSVSALFNTLYLTKCYLGHTAGGSLNEFCLRFNSYILLVFNENHYFFVSAENQQELLQKLSC